MTLTTLALYRALPPGRRLQTIRRTYGWPSEAVAAAAQVSQSYVWMWEAGLRPVPAAVLRWLDALPPPTTGRVAYYTPNAAGLVRAMAEQRLTWRRVADLCSVQPATVWGWRRGRVRLPLDVRAWLLAGAPVTGYAVRWPPRVDWLHGEAA